MGERTKQITFVQKFDKKKLRSFDVPDSFEQEVVASDHGMLAMDLQTNMVLDQNFLCFCRTI